MLLKSVNEEESALGLWASIFIISSITFVKVPKIRDQIEELEEKIVAMATESGL